MPIERTTIVITAALLMLSGAVALGAAQNIVFARSLGTDIETTGVWVGLAVLSACVKLSIPLVTKWYKSPLLLAAFSAALAFDILCALGHGALSRGTKIDEYEAALATRHNASQDVVRLERELTTIKAPAPPAEPSAAVRAKLESVRSSANCWRDDRGNCPVLLAPLKAQLAISETAEANSRIASAEHAKAAADLDKARSALKAIPVPVHPDPQAALFSRVLGITDRLAASLQTIVGMAIIELATLAGAIMVERSGRQPPYKGPASTQGPQLQPTPRARNPPTKPSKGLSAGALTALQILEGLVEGRASEPGLTVAGRAITGTQTAFALACGCSQPSVGRWFADLAATGNITVAKQGRTTVVNVN